MAMRPTGPQPKIATDLPGSKRAKSRPDQAVGKMSVRKSQSVSGEWVLGMGTRESSAKGTRTYSAFGGGGEG